MNEQQRMGALEAMLFAHGEPVELARLADAMHAEPIQIQVLLENSSASMTSGTAAWCF